MPDESLVVFRARRSVDDVGPDSDGPVLAWGVQFPNGWCFLDWNRDRFPEPERYDEPHVSMFGSLEDCEDAVDGFLETIYAEPVSDA